VHPSNTLILSSLGHPDIPSGGLVSKRLNSLFIRNASAGFGTPLIIIVFKNQIRGWRDEINYRRNERENISYFVTLHLETLLQK
jgi:hypothetical protein